MRYPTDNSYISSGYGWRTGIHGEENWHGGVDFPRPVHGNLYAIRDGRVTQNRWSAKGGWTLGILFDDGVLGIYQHMRNRSALLIGQDVKEGAIVGVMGDTGEYVQGVHLHFETLLGGVTFDPAPYLATGAPAGGGETPLPIPDPEDPEEEDEEMAMKAASYTRANGNVPVVLLFNEESGFWTEYTWGTPTINNAISGSWKTGPFVAVTESLASVLKADLDKTRTRTA